MAVAVVYFTASVVALESSPLGDTSKGIGKKPSLPLDRRELASDASTVLFRVGSLKCYTRLAH